MTIAQRINARMESRDTDEKGLALLDVLLGMAIFALIVVIGVQNFSTLRNRAYTTQVSSDVKQAATSIQAKLTEPNAIFWSPTANSAAAFVEPTVTFVADYDITAQVKALGMNPTGTNKVTYQSGGADNFVICVERTATGPSATYSSATSAVTTAAAGC